MMQKGGITAAELMAKLETDSEYLAKREAKEKEIERLAQECKVDEALLVSKLNQIGVSVSSVWDLVNNAPHPVLSTTFTDSYEVAYPVLVSHLHIPHHYRIREGIIRALTLSSAYELASIPLLSELAKESNQQHRWVIANALETMLPKEEFDQYPQIKEALDAGYL